MLVAEQFSKSYRQQHQTALSGQLCVVERKFRVIFVNKMVSHNCAKSMTCHGNDFLRANFN